MALTINTNVASLNAQRNLSSSQGTLETSLRRLSSGLRVNTAKDDAAGLFSIQKMTADIRGLNQAVRNAQDGISLAQTGEGAMDQIQSAMQRIREIAVQSANASVEDRSGLQAEVDQLTQEISRIVETTEFNGKSLLDGNGGSLTFQIGQDGTSFSEGLRRATRDVLLSVHPENEAALKLYRSFGFRLLNHAADAAGA